jgi:parallel beta-helix repeat protein
LWSFNTGKGVTASPTIVDGIVYIGSWSNNFYALNASTGALIWNYTTGDSIVFSSAAVANGVVYVGSGDGDVYAFNASTGTLVWNCKIGDLVWSSPVVANGMVYVGSGSSNVDALNASNGALIWSYDTGDEVVSSPAIDNDVVFIGSLNGNVYALNATDGTCIWSYQTDSYVLSSPAVTSGVVYITTDGNGNIEKDSDIYALNASTGALLWSYPTGVDSSPAVANGLVYAGGSDWKFYALNATTGGCVWNYMTGEPSSPAVAGGLVFVGDANYGKVYALDAFTGALIWSYQTGGSVSSSPAVCGGVVFIGSGDGKVYAFGQPPFFASVSPDSVGMDVGSSQLFNSSVAGGASPYTYQWYLNGAPIPGAVYTTWTFTPDSAGSYSVNVEVTDASGAVATSNTISVSASEPGSVELQNSTHTTIMVPDDYSTIQAAINAANPRDTIYVRNGIYQEHIEVNKTVTLMGESNQNTIIEAYEVEPPFCGIRITASNVTVENFNITGTCSLGTGVVFIDASVSGCSDNVIRNNNIATAVNGSSDTLDIMGGSGNIVEGNQIMVGDGSSDGIGVGVANNNTVNNNTVIGGCICIGVMFGYNNTVSNNYVTGQTLTGGFSDVGAIALGQTSGDVVTGNTMINNSIGLSVYAGDCSVYHNNFINNTQQALTESGSQVTFDKGYPSGGNYWSDYNGTDSFSGSGQNITGSDAIGDTPYVINGSNVDHYPFVNALSTGATDPPTTIPGDINGDGKVNLQDLVIFANAYGTTPASGGIPGDPHAWNPNADINGDLKVDDGDLAILANHYEQHYP